MSKHCENCGCNVGIHGCENCNEELYILDQYSEQGMDYPDEKSDFIEKVRKIQNK